MLASLFWNVFSIISHITEITKSNARTCLKKDLEFRVWAAEHDDTYALLSKKNQPNLLLEKLPNREVESSSGDTLTFMNHMYMLKQFQHQTIDSSKVIQKIISLDPKNPHNKPDSWEQSALLQFKNGIEKIEGYSTINGEKYFRIIHPIKIEKKCFKCHEGLGYKVDDVIGGVSISFYTAS